MQTFSISFVGHGKGKPEKRHRGLRDKGLLLFGQIIQPVYEKVISWEINIIRWFHIPAMVLFNVTWYRKSGRNMSIIPIGDKIRLLSIVVDTNQSTNIGNR